MECQLYDQLAKKAPSFDDQKEREKQWRQICPVINRLPLENLENIYVLILHHQKEQKAIIPYGGKTFDTGKGVIYTVANLPTRLQEIILQYIKDLVSI